VIDRIRRAISTIGDRVSDQLEPIATSLGKSFGVADWAVELFSEEVLPTCWDVPIAKVVPCCQNENYQVTSCNAWGHQQAVTSLVALKCPIFACRSGLLVSRGH